MPVLKASDKKSVWQSICKEYEEKYKKKDKDLIEFDPAKHSPIFYGFSFASNKVDDEHLLKDFDSSISSPICVGFSLHPCAEVNEETQPLETQQVQIVDTKACTEREYIEALIFPTLLPILESMLAEAKKHRCFERKRTAFNGCDYITEFLYKNNPFCSQEELENRRSLDFWDIPFVKEWNSLYPRPPLPKSLIWTEDEAAIRIQAYYRGHLVRRDPEVQELRKWQKEMREENQNILIRVEKFWNDSSALPTATPNNNKRATFNETSTLINNNSPLTLQRN